MPASLTRSMQQFRDLLHGTKQVTVYLPNYDSVVRVYKKVEEELVSVARTDRFPVTITTLQKPAEQEARVARYSNNPHALMLVQRNMFSHGLHFKADVMVWVTKDVTETFEPGHASYALFVQSMGRADRGFIQPQPEKWVVDATVLDEYAPA